MTQMRFRCRALRRSGATDVRVIAAASEGAARERLLAAGLEPLSIEAVGPSLFAGLGDLRLPRWRPGMSPPARPMMIAAALFASIPFTVAAGAWTLAAMAGGKAGRIAVSVAPTGRADLPYMSHAARADFAASLSRRPLGDVVLHLSAALPQNASLASMTRDRAGQIAITIDTPDPDQLRLAIADDRLLASLAEIGQSRTENGAIRVTLHGVLR